MLGTMADAGRTLLKKSFLSTSGVAAESKEAPSPAAEGIAASPTAAAAAEVRDPAVSPAWACAHVVDAFGAALLGVVRAFLVEVVNLPSSAPQGGGAAPEVAAPPPVPPKPDSMKSPSPSDMPLAEASLSPETRPCIPGDFCVPGGFLGGLFGGRPTGEPAVAIPSTSNQA